MTTSNPTSNIKYSETMEGNIDEIRTKLKNPITFRYHHVDAQTGIVSEFMCITIEKCEDYDFYSDDNDMVHDQRMGLCLLITDFWFKKKKTKQFRKLSLPLRRFIKKFATNKVEVVSSQSRLWDKKSGEPKGYCGIPLVDVFFTGIPEGFCDTKVNQDYIDKLLNHGTKSYYDKDYNGEYNLVVNNVDTAIPETYWN